MLRLADAIRDDHVAIARFNFLYKEHGRGRPDRMPTLMSTYAAVVASIRDRLSPSSLIIGGHSMGGRTASMMAAEGVEADGLLLLSYPLHPAGKPEKLRDGHLPDIDIPTLCINGTRDKLCTPELMDAVLTRVRPSFRMHWLDGADHGYHVLKRSGRTDDEVMDEIGKVTADWLHQT